MYPWGVKVSILEPGSFRTNIHSNLAKNFKDRWEALDDNVKEEYGEEYLNGGIIISLYFAFHKPG